MEKYHEEMEIDAYGKSKNKICTEPHRPDACGQFKNRTVHLPDRPSMRTAILSCVSRIPDQERFQEGAVDIIYRTLEKTGLIPR